MKTGFLVLAAVTTLSSAMYGQAAPTAVASNSTVGTTSLAPSLGTINFDGTLHYSLSASELFQHGLYTGTGMDYSTSLSGMAGYVSNSRRHPSSLLFSGGLIITTQNQATFQTFQNLAVSQQYVTPRWVFGVSDSVSYLPQSPTTGYSGIPGVGDIGTIEGPSQGPAGGILTNYGNRVSNTLTGNVERMLTASTSISGSGGWDILRFLDGTGLDTTDYYGNASLNHRIDARTTISGSASYSIFEYGSYPPGYIVPPGLNDLTIQTRGLSLSVQRLLSHNLSVSVSAGPQLISSSNSLYIPSDTIVGGSVNASYSRKVSTFSLSYSRGSNGGSGVQQGSISDTVVASYLHSYGRDWQMAISGSYIHSKALIQNQEIFTLLGISGSYDSAYGGVQFSRRLGPHASAFFSYTAAGQASSGSNSSPNVFSGVMQTFGIGVTWTPRSTQLGQF